MNATMNVDAIFVITLDTAESRRQIMDKWYPKDMNMTWFVVKRMKNPVKGCYTSHQKALRTAKNKKYKRILILEDDAFPLFDWNCIVKYTNKNIDYLNKKIPDWRHLMLGYIPFRMDKLKDNENLLKVRCAVDTHAYIVNVNNVKSIPWNGIPIDEFLFCTKKTKKGLTLSNYSAPKEDCENKNYAVYPMLITQKTTESNIHPTHLWQTKFIEFFGDEQNMVDISTRYNTLSLIVFSMLILFLISVLFTINCIDCLHPIPNTCFYGNITISIFVILFLILLFI